MLICVHEYSVHGGQIPIPWRCSYKQLWGVWYGCWESNSRFLKKQYMLLNTETCLQLSLLFNLKPVFCLAPRWLHGQYTAPSRLLPFCLPCWLNCYNATLCWFWISERWHPFIAFHQCLYLWKLASAQTEHTVPTLDISLWLSSLSHCSLQCSLIF